MKGYWFFLASAGLCGISYTIGVPWPLIILFHLFWLRIIRLRNKKVLCFAFVTFILSTILGFYASHSRETHFNSTRTTFTIIFTQQIEFDGNRIKSIVNTDKEEKLALNYIIQSEIEKEQLIKKLRIGESCIVKGQLISPEKNRNPSLFNYQKYLFRNNIFWTLKVDYFDKCYKSRSGILTRLQALRDRGLTRVESIYSKSLIPYAKALLFGDSSGFEQETYSLYQRLGIIHLLAISGLHVGIITAGIFYFLIRMGISRETSQSCLFVILPLYALLSGANPPVVRAVLMALLLLSSIRWKLPFTSLDTLAISFLLFILKDPYIIFNIGFQLSFIVSLSILMSSKTIMVRFNKFFPQIIVISLISQISSLPVLANAFYEVSIISIVSNIVYVPLYSFFVLPSFLISYCLSYISSSLFDLFNLLLTLIMRYLELFGQLLNGKWSVLITGKPNIYFSVLLIITTFLTLKLLEEGRNIYKCLFPVTVSVFTLIMAQLFNPFGCITFIDVGQGDSILIELPLNRGTYLIDTGGQMNFQTSKWMERKHSFQVGQDILLPLFKSKGIRKIDKLILTHSDADHMGAAVQLINRIKIKEINISPHSWEKPIMNELLGLAQKNKIPVLEVKKGVKWNNKSGDFQFLFPFDSEYEGNNDSLVLYATIGGKKWLFTGDIEKESELELVNHYSTKVDVLKVAHHGSKTSTSSDFVEKLQPDYAIISVGVNNRFGHPHSKVLDVLKTHNVIIFRTDKDGAIEYHFFQNHGTFRTVIP